MDVPVISISRDTNRHSRPRVRCAWPGARRFVWVTRHRFLLTLLFLVLCSWPDLAVAAAAPAEAQLPLPLSSYPASPGATLIEILKERIRIEPFNLVATGIFLAAILHTFFASRFLQMAHRCEHRLKQAEAEDPISVETEHHHARLRFKAEILHLLGEVEAIFGIWAVPLLIAITLNKSWGAARDYISHGRNFTEPLFVVVIMTIASSRPILELSERILSLGARLGRGSPAAWWLSILIIGPLLGSFVTEPAAMTISALLLAKRFYALGPSPRFAYATLGLLFVNISIGGTLTHFAAPPVLMVAGQWGWGLAHMLEHFGWKALVGTIASSLFYFAMFRRELASLAGKVAIPPSPSQQAINVRAGIPFSVTSVHLLFLAWTVLNSHYPALFIGGFLFYLAFTRATEYFQDEVALRPALLVGFFLAGLVVHAGLQGWWIEPVLSRLTEIPLFLGAGILTAFNDNAAITYLASLVPGFSPQLQYAVVAGAVVGGGLTVIANAPNPAGQSILSRFFPDGVSPLGLVLGALTPTIIVGAIFLVFR
jgi:hypothetical protein